MCGIEKKENNDLDRGIANSKAAEERIEQIIGDSSKAKRFLLLARVEINQNPKLQSCNNSSILTCLIKTAELGLFIGGGEVYLIPYAKTCTMQVGYLGMMKLLYRAGMKSIRSDVVYENDHFKYRNGTKCELVHSRPFGDRGKIIGVYAVAKVGTENIIEIMSKEELDTVQKHSANANSVPWNKFYDEMAKKTVIKRLFKRLPHENLNLALVNEAENVIVDKDVYIQEEEVEKISESNSDKSGLGSNAIVQIL